MAIQLKMLDSLTLNFPSLTFVCSDTLQLKVSPALVRSTRRSSARSVYYTDTVWVIIPIVCNFTSKLNKKLVNCILIFVVETSSSKSNNWLTVFNSNLVTSYNLIAPQALLVPSRVYKNSIVFYSITGNNSLEKLSKKSFLIYISKLVPSLDFTFFDNL